MCIINISEDLIFKGLDGIWLIFSLCSFLISPLSAQIHVRLTFLIPNNKNLANVNKNIRQTNIFNVAVYVYFLFSIFILTFCIRQKSEIIVCFEGIKTKLLFSVKKRQNTSAFAKVLIIEELYRISGIICLAGTTREQRIKLCVFMRYSILIDMFTYLNTSKIFDKISSDFSLKDHHIHFIFLIRYLGCLNVNCFNLQLFEISLMGLLCTSPFADCSLIQHDDKCRNS